MFPPPPIETGDCDQLRRNLRSLQQTRSMWATKLASDRDPDVPGGSQDSIRQIIALIDQEIAATQHQLNECNGPLPPKRFVIDPWQLVTPSGIDTSKKGDGSIWETGSVWCALPVGGRRLLLGTENGGLWLSESDGTGGYNSTCLSNSWPYWRVWCLVADPKDATRVFAGCNSGGLYLGNASSAPAAQTWTRIPLPVTMATADILAMIIIPGSRVLVIGTTAGLAWFSMDSFPFVWHSEPSMFVDDLAILAEDAFAIVARPSGTDPSANTLSVAQIQNNSYVSNPVHAIDWQKAPYSFAPLRVASCKSQPDNVYCIGTKVIEVVGRDRAFFTTEMFVIRSRDSGRNWKEGQYGGNLPQGNDLAVAIDFGDPGVKTRRGLSVHPTRPEVVATGCLSVAVSPNAGDSWDTETYRGHVNDIHEICFDDEADVIYVPSDKGLLTIGNWAPWVPGIPRPEGQATFDSLRNKTLPVVMLYAPSSWYDGTWPWGGQYGNLSVSDDGGLITSGSQDQADLWCSPNESWGRVDGGDGCAVSVSCVGTRQLLIHNSQNGKPSSASWALWKNSSFQDQGTIPIRRSGGTLDGAGLAPLIRPVSNVAPVFTSVVVSVDGRSVRKGPLPVIALATQYPGANVIYGAVDNPFATPPATPPAVEWIELVSLPPLLGDVIKVEPYSASQVLAGTSEGHLVIAKVGGTAQPSATALRYPYEEIEFAQENASGGIDGIAAAGELVVAIRGNYLYVRYSAGGKMERLSAAAFPPNGRGDAKFAAIAMNRNPAFQRLSCAVVVRDGGRPDQMGEVWVSNSPIAAIWHKVSDGLPVAARPSDVVFSNNPRFGELFLSTYGRGVWRTTF